MDINAIIIQLREFLNSSDPTRRFAENVNSNRDLMFGLDVYRKYILYLCNEREKQCRPNIKPMYNLWEHKKLMNERLKYLVSQNLIRENNQGIQGYKELERKFRTMVNLLIKSKIKKDYSDYDKVIGMLANSIQKERIAIETVLNEL